MFQVQSPKVGTISTLHSVIGGSTTTLRTDPVNILTVILDVAGLAVDAVRGINDETNVTLIVWLILIHTSWAKPDRINY